MRILLLTVYGGGMLFALINRIHAPWWWWAFGIFAVVGALLVPEPGSTRDK